MYPDQWTGSADPLNASPSHNLPRILMAPQKEKGATSELTEFKAEMTQSSELPSQVFSALKEC